MCEKSTREPQLVLVHHRVQLPLLHRRLLRDFMKPQGLCSSQDDVYMGRGHRAASSTTPACPMGCLRSGRPGPRSGGTPLQASTTVRLSIEQHCRTMYICRSVDERRNPHSAPVRVEQSRTARRVPIDERPAMASSFARAYAQQASMTVSAPPARCKRRRERLKS